MRPARITATLVVGAIWTLCISSGSDAASTFVEGSIWELSGTATEERWLELHEKAPGLLSANLSPSMVCSTMGMTVGTSRQLMAAGSLLATVALVRIGVTLRGALSAHPDRTARLFLRLGYSPQPNEAEMLIVGYLYAFLRRSFPEFEGTAVEQQRTAILLWFSVFFVGLSVGLAGVVIAAAGN
jgi:hypothetical protein